MTKVTDEYPKNTTTPPQPLIPTEIIDLPSKGLLYSIDSVLAKGEIEMRYMTARDEDVLSSASLIKSGVALDRVLSSLIVTPIEYNDLLIGDKNAIMVAARILAYGKEYTVNIECPRCGERHKQVFDLTSFKDKELNMDVIEEGKNEFEFKLPYSEKIVVFKLLNHSDVEEMRIQDKKMKKIVQETKVNNLITSRLIHSIISLDGNTDKNVIRRFVITELLSRDSVELRKYIKSISPDINMTFDFDCDECGYTEIDQDIPLERNFFWPGA